MPQVGSSPTMPPSSVETVQPLPILEGGPLVTSQNNVTTQAIQIVGGSQNQPTVIIQVASESLAAIEISGTPNMQPGQGVEILPGGSIEFANFTGAIWAIMALPQTGATYADVRVLTTTFAGVGA